MRNEIKNTLALLLINKGGRFATVDGMCRILSTFFDVIDCVDLMKELKYNKYITTKVELDIDILPITSIGYNCIECNYLNTIDYLRNNFPNANKIINFL